jgi:hypothetical protein
MRDLMAALSSGVAARRCGSNITEWRAGARILYDSPLAIATPFNVCWAICAIESVVRPAAMSPASNHHVLVTLDWY